MNATDPDLRRTWLFGPGADGLARQAMLHSGADALIADLEDFTPPARREPARGGLGGLLQGWRDAGRVDVRRIAAGRPCIRGALLGAEDLAADLCAERQPDAVEVDHARRRSVLGCRAASIEPIDAPYTLADVDGAVREALYARRLATRG